MSATKKLAKRLKKIKSQNPNRGYVDGGAYTRHIFETALVELFGRKLGLLVSDFLLNKGLKKEQI